MLTMPSPIDFKAKDLTIKKTLDTSSNIDKPISKPSPRAFEMNFNLSKSLFVSIFSLFLMNFTMPKLMTKNEKIKPR